MIRARLPSPAIERRALVPLWLMVTLSLVACGGSSTSPPAAAGTATATAAPSPTPLPTPTPQPSPPSASDIIAAAKAVGLPIAEVTVFTAETDPNHSLGRPHQYTGKATWHDSRLPAGTTADISDGGSIETFVTVDDLHTRASYVENIAKTPIFAEYDYVSDKGLFFLRLSGKLTPDQAMGYAQVAKARFPDLAGPA